MIARRSRDYAYGYHCEYLATFFDGEKHCTTTSSVKFTEMGHDDGRRIVNFTLTSHCQSSFTARGDRSRWLHWKFNVLSTTVVCINPLKIPDESAHVSCRPLLVDSNLLRKDMWTTSNLRALGRRM